MTVLRLVRYYKLTCHPIVCVCVCVDKGVIFETDSKWF